jgi:ATP-dependent DNA helicase RecG
LTLAAALIFGKDQTIHSLVPAYKVEALVRRKDLDRYDDRITLRTNLIDTYLQLMDFIRKHLDERFYQEGIQRKDLRELIFREIIGNIIVHREYTSALSTDLIIYKDRVFATNPNRPYFHGPIDPIEFNPHPKNPIIRRFFTAFGWTDEIGSGIRNTNKFLTYYAPGAKPLFYEDDLFKTEIPLVNSSLIAYFDEILAWTDLPAAAKGHLTSALSQISIDPILFASPWKEVILHLVPSWHQRGTMLSELDWPKKQPVTKEDIQEVPSWHQKSTMLLHKKSRYILLILLLSSEPIKLEMLMKWLSYSNRSTFRKNYLNPLQKAGWVRMTNPDNPKDPDQKYITTEQGKLFLAGRAIEML